jgi:hypothetical protein
VPGRTSGAGCHAGPLHGGTLLRLQIRRGKTLINEQARSFGVPYSENGLDVGRALPAECADRRAMPALHKTFIHRVRGALRKFPVDSQAVGAAHSCLFGILLADACFLRGISL